MDLLNLPQSSLMMDFSGPGNISETILVSFTIISNGTINAEAVALYLEQLVASNSTQLSNRGLFVASIKIVASVYEAQSCKQSIDDVWISELTIFAASNGGLPHWLIIGVAVVGGFCLTVILVLVFLMLHGKRKTTAIVTLPEAPEGEVLSPKRSSRKERESQNLNLLISKSNSSSSNLTRPNSGESKQGEFLEGYEVS